MGAGRKSLETLEDVVEGAYSAFNVPKPKSLGVCKNCCMYPKVEADFLNPAIRNLPDHYLQDWFFAAADIPLDKDIWAYLLPRVLDSLAQGKEPATVGIEVSLSRFPTGDPDQWSEEQWHVLDRFHRLFIDHQKTNKEDFLDDILCMFGEARFSAEVSLNTLNAWSDEELTQKLWQDWCAIGRHGIWTTAFWEDEAHTPIYHWFRSELLLDRLMRFGLSQNITPEMLQKVSQVTAVIQGELR